MLIHILIFLIIIYILYYLYYSYIINTINQIRLTKKQQIAYKEYNASIKDKEYMYTDIVDGTAEQQLVSKTLIDEINKDNYENMIDTNVANMTQKTIILDINNNEEVERLTGINPDDIFNKIDKKNRDNLILSLALLPVNLIDNLIITYTIILCTVLPARGAQFLIKTAKTTGFKSLGTIIGKAAVNSATKILTKIITQIKLLRTSINALTLSATKAATQAAAKAGTQAAAKAGTQAVAKAGTQATAKAGTSVAATGTAAAITAGLATPLLVFSLGSIALDLIDTFGNNAITNYQQGIMVGGELAALTTSYKSAYLALRKQYDNAYNKLLSEKGIKQPIITGPLNVFEEEQLISELTSVAEDAILEYYNDPNNVEELITFIKNNLHNTNLTEEEYINSILEIIIPKVYEIQLQKVCNKFNGNNVKLDGELYCSYKSKSDTKASYSWPLKENEIYSEWNNKGYSYNADYTMRAICEENGLPYDEDKGICIVDEKYCLARGLDWVYNNDIKEYDCKLDDTQNIFEFIFGTTVLRSLKQIFDSKQYEPCKSDEIDDGYLCRKIECKENEEYDAGLCYPKCKDNYKGVGHICWENCPNDTTDVGLFCSKGGDVYAKQTKVPTKNPCPDDMRDDGTSCWKDTYGRGGGYAYWDRDKCSIDNPQGCEWYGALYYPKCKTGYHSVGCCLCEPDDGPGGIRKTLFDRQSCESGYRNIAGVCWPDCKEGYNDDGVFCRKNLDTKTKDSYNRGTGTVPKVTVRPKTRKVTIGGK